MFTMKKMKYLQLVPNKACKQDIRIVFCYNLIYSVEVVNPVQLLYISNETASFSGSFAGRRRKRLVYMYSFNMGVLSVP